MASLSRESKTQGRDPLPDPDRSLGALAGVVLGVLGIVFSVLTAVTSLAAAMLAIGVVVGLVLGVLITPGVRRAAIWLSEYLKR